MKRECRRKYLIDKDMQHYVLKTFVWVVLIVAITFSVLLIRMNYYMSESLFQTFQGVNINSAVNIDLTQIQEDLTRKDIYFVLHVSIAVVLIGLLVAFMAIRFSHKIAGPIYRLKIAFREVEKGDLTCRVHTRKKDKLKGLVQLFNNMMDFVEQNAKDKNHV